MRKPAFFIILNSILLTSAHAAGVKVYYPLGAERDTVTSVLPNIDVVSATAPKSVISSTPFQSIDAGKIKTAGITDIADAMRRLPGINLRDYGGAGGLKTVSVRGLGSEHTSVVYDGVALSDCQSGQIDLSRYSLDNVRALSLYSGDNEDIFIPARAASTASSLYISSFVLPESEDMLPHVKAQMRVGAFGYYNPFVRFTQNIGERVSFSGNAEYIHSKNNYPFTLKNGSHTSREKRENSTMNSWHGELNLGWKPQSGGMLSGKVYYYDNSRDLPGPVIYYVTKSNEHLRERNFFGQLQYKRKFSSKLSILSLAKYNWATSRYEDIGGEYPGGKLDNYYIQREAYASCALLYLPAEGLALDYSADWAWNNLTSNTPSSIRPYRNSILQNVAVKYSFWKISAMARALYSIYINKAKDGEAGKNAHRLSPSVSISVKPIDDADFFLRASYKNIFRLPTFNEAYFDNYGSINLNPETTDQINVGVTYSTSSIPAVSNLSVTCDGYVNHVDNKIVAVPYNMFIWTMSNLGKVRVYGLDASLNAEFGLGRSQSLQFSATYSYQRAQIRTSPEKSDWMKQVAYIPLNSGSASLSWLNPWVSVAVHTTATGSRYTTNFNMPETKIAGFADTGISVFRKFKAGRGNMEARVDIMNIFDCQYEVIARYPMPGRAWRATIEFDI